MSWYGSVRTGDIGNVSYLRHGQQPRAERVVDGFLLQVNVAEIVMNKAYDPDAFADLLDAHTLAASTCEMMIILRCAQMRP